MIVVNFKTYPQSTGENALALAKICEEVSEETGVKVIICVQAVDIYPLKSQVKIPIFGQHADALIPDRNTGWTTSLALKKAGASGVLLNHSEHPFNNFENLDTSIKLAKKEGLKTLVFVKDLQSAIKVDKYNPTYSALEEPSLVASETAMIQLPKFHYLIRKFIESITTLPLVGAGIKNREDIFQSLKIGIKGVVLSSHFVKASDPKAFLLNCASSFSK